MELKRANDFRWIFANGFNLQMSDNEVLLTLGITEDVAAPDKSILAQVGVALTPKSAKLLGHILSQGIAGWEQASGNTIPLDPTKITEIAAAVARGVKKTGKE